MPQADETSPSLFSRVSRLRRPFAALLAGTLVATLALSGTAAEAQTVESLRARAAQLSDELDELEQRSLVLNERFLTTQAELEELEAETAANAAAVATAQADLEKSQGEASGFLVQAYVGGGAHNPLAVGSADPNEVVNQQVLLKLLRGDRQAVADKMSASKEDLEIRSADLRRSTEALEAKKAEQQGLVDELDAAVDRQSELLNSTNRDLNAAVRAERERREAEAAARARAEAERAAQAAAATQAQRSSVSAGSAASGGSSATTTPRRSGGSSGSAGAAAPAPAPAPAPPVSGPSSGAGAAIAAARSMMGTPYRYGGTTPAGFDCSGLMQWAWARAGVSLPRTSGAQRAATQRISFEQLQPGDLVFSGNPVYHVGMYVGGGQMIHSPRTGDVVKISPVRYMGATSYGRIR